jgi:hypothetical protein
MNFSLQGVILNTTGCDRALMLTSILLPILLSDIMEVCTLYSTITIHIVLMYSYTRKICMNIVKYEKEDESSPHPQGL